MSPPHHQIPSLWLRHSLKSFHSVIKIVRTRIGIRKPSPLVNCMHQMRAIALRVARCFRIERGSNHCQPVVRTHRPCALSPTLRPGCPVRSRFPGKVSRTCRSIARRPSSLLRPRHTKREPTEQNHERGFSPIPHDSILMPSPPPALVTIVQRPDCKSPRSPHVGTAAPGCPAAKRRKGLPRRTLVSWDLSSQRVTASSPHGGTPDHGSRITMEPMCGKGPPLQYPRTPDHLLFRPLSPRTAIRAHHAHACQRRRRRRIPLA